MKLIDVMKAYNKAVLRENAKLKSIYNTLIREAKAEGLDVTDDTPNANECDINEKNSDSCVDGECEGYAVAENKNKNKCCGEQCDEGQSVSRFFSSLLSEKKGKTCEDGEKCDDGKKKCCCEGANMPTFMSAQAFFNEISKKETVPESEEDQEAERNAEQTLPAETSVPTPAPTPAPTDDETDDDIPTKPADDTPPTESPVEENDDKGEEKGKKRKMSAKQFLEAEETALPTEQSGADADSVQNALEESMVMYRRANRRLFSQFLNESEDQPLNEMTVRKIDNVIKNPITIERNWDDILDILTGNELIEFFDCNSALQKFFRYKQVIQPSRDDNFGEPLVMWTLFGGEENTKFIEWLEQKKNFNYSDKLKDSNISWGWTDGDLIMQSQYHDGYDGPFTEYQTNDINKFKTFVTEFMSDMGYTNAKYVIGILPIGGSNSEMAKQLAEILKNKNSEVYKVLSQYLFSDKDDEFDYEDEDEDEDEILSQANEVYQEQYMSSIAAGGSDPCGDAEYAREKFLSKHRIRRR